MRRNVLFSILCLFVAIILGFIASQIWLPSVIILSLCIFVVPIKSKIQNLIWILFIGTYSILNYGFLISSFTNLDHIVAEELPLIGIIFILHIFSFWKYIPKKYLIPTFGLIILGLIKLKYLYIATPFLLIGLVAKEKEHGLYIKDNRIPLLFIILILGVGWIITSSNLYPTYSDTQEIKELIQLSNDSNIPLYNDFGNGWLITYLGYETKYKIGYPEPDYNNLTRPFYAYSSKKLDCTKINKKSYSCESLIS